MKKSSSLKPEGLDYRYLVSSFTKWTFTKFVQIIALGPKMAPPGGHMCNIGLYRQNVKNLLV